MIGSGAPAMFGLVLTLSLGLMPAPAVRAGLPVEPSSLHLQLDLHARAGQLDELGRVLGNGIPLVGTLSIGLEGQPSAPFLSNFMHQQELRIAPRIDPEAVASSVLIQLRATLD